MNTNQLQPRKYQQKKPSSTSTTTVRLPLQLMEDMRLVRAKYDVSWSKIAAEAFQAVVDQAKLQDTTERNV